MKYILAAVVVMLLVVGIFLSRRVETTSTSTSDGVQDQTPSAAQLPTDQQDESSASDQVPGAYVDYKEGLIESTSGTKILFFHASWCPQCRALDASIKAGEVPAGVTIMKVDYDTNQSLRQKYGVTIQTTLVKVDDAGKLVEKYVAYDSPTLAAVRENLL